MKILQVNNRYEHRGGADIVFIEEGSKLLELGNEIARIFISTPNTIKSKSKFNYIVHYYFNQNDNVFKRILKFPLFFFNPFAFKKTLNAIKEFRPDIIHYHLYKGELTWGVVLAGRICGVKLVLTSHDYGLVDPHNLLLDGRSKISLKTLISPFWSVIDKSNRNSYILSFLSYIEYKLERFFINPNNHFGFIICVSQFQKMIYFNSRLSIKNNIEIISNYSRLESINNHHSNQNYYLYVGRISNEKGIIELIDVFSKLNNYKLKIVGGNRSVKQEEFNNIEWLGKLQGIELANLMQNAKFVIVPSICHENNSLTILESLSLGTPVISSDYGGSPEMVINHKTGYTFSHNIVGDFNKKIRASGELSDLEYNKISKNSKEFYFSNYSREIHFKKLLSLYKNIIDE
jgi:glycosyltransferase involved in cell wall biosynthesis